MSLTFTPAEILTSVRDRSPYFDASRIPGGTALRLFFEAERALLAKVEARDPRAVAATTLQPILGADALAAVTTLAGIDPTTPDSASPSIFDVHYRLLSDQSTDQLHPLQQIDYESRLTWSSMAYSVQDGSLYFSGPVADWSAVNFLIVYGYTIIADPLRNDGQPSSLQYAAKDALVARVAESFARRLDGTPASLQAPDFSQLIRLNLEQFQQATLRAEYEYLKQITQQRNRGALTIPNGVEFQP